MPAGDERKWRRALIGSDCAAAADTISRDVGDAKKAGVLSPAEVLALDLLLNQLRDWPIRMRDDNDNGGK